MPDDEVRRILAGQSDSPDESQIVGQNLLRPLRQARHQLFCPGTLADRHCSVCSCCNVL